MTLGDTDAREERSLAAERVGEEHHQPGRDRVLDPARRRAAARELAQVPRAPQRGVEQVREARERKEEGDEDRKWQAPRLDVDGKEVPADARGLALHEIESRLVDWHAQRELAQREGRHRERRVKERHRRVPAREQPGRHDHDLERGRRHAQREGGGGRARRTRPPKWSNLAW